MLKEKVEEALAQAEESGVEHIHPEDPEAGSMKCEGQDIPYRRTRLKGKRWVRVYRSAQACKGCAAFGTCTRDRHGRSIDMLTGMWALRDMERRINQEAAKAKLAYRKGIVEPVFARIKQHGGFRRWSVGGLKKVGAKWVFVIAIHGVSSLATLRPPAGRLREVKRFEQRGHGPHHTPSCLT